MNEKSRARVQLGSKNQNKSRACKNCHVASLLLSLILPPFCCLLHISSSFQISLYPFCFSLILILFFFCFFLAPISLFSPSLSLFFNPPFVCFSSTISVFILSCSLCTSLSKSSCLSGSHSSLLPTSPVISPLAQSPFFLSPFFQYTNHSPSPSGSSRGKDVQCHNFCILIVELQVASGTAQPLRYAQRCLENDMIACIEMLERQNLQLLSLLLVHTPKETLGRARHLA